MVFLKFYIQINDPNKVPITYAIRTATPARIAAPIYEGTPPDVYVLGIYCKINDLGVDNEIIRAAAKNPK